MQVQQIQTALEQIGGVPVTTSVLASALGDVVNIRKWLSMAALACVYSTACSVSAKIWIFRSLLLMNISTLPVISNRL